jgi:hypothetical protein
MHFISQKEHQNKQQQSNKNTNTYILVYFESLAVHFRAERFVCRAQAHQNSLNWIARIRTITANEKKKKKEKKNSLYTMNPLPDLFLAAMKLSLSEGTISSRARV